MLLQKWCSQKQINANNYELWIEFLHQHYSSRSDEEQDKSCQEICPIHSSISSEVEAYYLRLKQKKVEGHKHLRMTSQTVPIYLKEFL